MNNNYKLMSRNAYRGHGEDVGDYTYLFITSSQRNDVTAECK